MMKVNVYDVKVGTNQPDDVTIVTEALDADNDHAGTYLMSGTSLTGSIFF